MVARIFLVWKEEVNAVHFTKLLHRRRSSANPRPEPIELADDVRKTMKSDSAVQDRQQTLPFVAYRIKEGGPTIEVASAARKWMNETAAGFANRCLPLRIANQSGWFILSHERVEVAWDGTAGVNGLVVTKGTLDDQFLSSHFGHGILTWKMPYLFKTPVGYNLYVRGPANWCKDGASALDGIVETDWAVSTFTMNWKITRIGVPIRFEKGEPICMIFPIARGDIQRFEPEIRRLQDDPDLETQFKEWKHSRDEFNQQVHQSRSKGDWQKHYYLGKTNRGETFSAHQLSVKLRGFREQG